MTPFLTLPGLPDSRRAPGPRLVGERSRGLGEMFARGALRRPQDLLSLIFGQREREEAIARPTGPRVEITICCFTPDGRPAVEISL